MDASAGSGVRKAIEGSPFSAEFRTTLESIYGGGETSPSFWLRLRLEVVEPLEGLVQKQAEHEEAEGSAAKQLALAVDVAQALATRPCAHVRCTTLLGASEADEPRGKLCSGCRAVRYCGAACQKADWRAHKAACRELARRMTSA